ncbi:MULTISPECIES: MFS transporter [Sphingobium]|uniref:MFS transporter n=1 Tax=Sphingobium sp. MI1205 TaxID=407020 RepID=UPI0011A853EC
MISITILDIVIQTVSPRWVAGRALAAFQTAVAVGSWGWGPFGPMDSCRRDIAGRRHSRLAPDGCCLCHAHSSP